MKVCSKKAETWQFDVLDQSPLYYIARNSIGQALALSKEEYVPVPEWRDFTAENDGVQASQLLSIKGDEYRLTRKEVDVLQKNHTYMAYILERKVQP